MRKFAWITPLLLLVLADCRKIKNDINEAIEFELPYTTEVTVPSTSVSLTAPADFTSPEIATESTARFAQNKTTKDRVREITLKKFIVTADKGTLDHLKGISVFLKAPGLSEVLVATKETIPANATSFNADVTNTDIKEHLFAEKIQLRIRATFTSGMNEDQKLKIEQAFLVKANVIQ